MIDENILKERKNNFDANGGYHQNPMPEIYTYYKEYVASGKYPYLRSVQDYILTKENINPELHKYLETEVYLASQQYHKERDLAHAEKMIADGWTPLTCDLVKTVFANKQKIRLSADVDGMLATYQIDRIYKPFVDNMGNCYLMKPKARRSGYPLHHFDNAFCKVI